MHRATRHSTLRPDPPEPPRQGASSSWAFRQARTLRAPLADGVVELAHRPPWRRCSLPSCRRRCTRCGPRAGGECSSPVRTLWLYSSLGRTHGLELTSRRARRQRPGLAVAPRHPLRPRRPTSTRPSLVPLLLRPLGPLDPPDVLTTSTRRRRPAEPPGPPVDARPVRPQPFVAGSRAVGRPALGRRAARPPPVGHAKSHGRARRRPGRRGVRQRGEGRARGRVGRRPAAREPRVPARFVPQPKGASATFTMFPLPACKDCQLMRLGALQRAGQPPHGRLRRHGPQAPHAPLPHHRRHPRRVPAARRLLHRRQAQLLRLCGASSSSSLWGVDSPCGTSLTFLAVALSMHAGRRLDSASSPPLVPSLRPLR